MCTTSHGSQARKPESSHPAEVGDRGRAPDRRQVALVAIAERRARPRRAARADDRSRRSGPAASRPARRRAAACRSLQRRRGVADDEDLGMAGDREVGLDHHAARAIERHAERRGERRRGDAGGPEHGARGDALLAERARRRASIAVTGVPRRTSTPSALELRAPRFAESAREKARACAGRPRAGRRAPRADRCGGSPLRACARAISAIAPASSTPVGPPPMTTKVSSARCALGIGLALGRLEGEQDAAPDLQRVLDGLEAGRELRPLVVAEVGVASRRWRGRGSRSASAPSSRTSSLRGDVDRRATSASSTSVFAGGGGRRGSA